MSTNPFQPLEATLETALDSKYRYRALRVLTILVAIAFSLEVVMILASQVSVAVLRGHDPRVLSGAEPRDLSSALLAVVLFFSSVLYLLLYVGGAILFFIWLVRANKNARALGSRDMEFTPGAMVGWFFVPVLNLFRPYEAVDELYLASDPESDGDSWGAAQSSGYILPWWLSWIAFGLVGGLGQVFIAPGSPVGLIVVLLGGLSASLAITVMISIERRQVEKQRRVSLAPPSLVAPTAGPSHRFL